MSLAVTAVWVWASALTIGPADPLHLTWRHPVVSYLTLAAAPTGNAGEPLAVVAFIDAACLLACGWRRRGGDPVMARRRVRYGRSRVAGGFVASAVTAGILLAVLGHHGRAAVAAPGIAATKAIAYAGARIGDPYTWGGAGPYAVDCSGLVMMAYRAAAVGIVELDSASEMLQARVAEAYRAALEERNRELADLRGQLAQAQAPGPPALTVLQGIAEPPER